ncbi:MAG: glucokinase [Rhizobiaceae bacterium]
MTFGPRHALVGDIGGTNARFAIADVDELSIDHFAAFSCRHFSSLEEALKAYLATLPCRPARACLAIAAPLRGDSLKLTNLHWTFSQDSLRRASGIEALRLINDFEALALVLPHLVPHDLCSLGRVAPRADQPRAVLGPGTGLGMAGLVPCGDGWRAVASEGGHVAFAAETQEEFEIMRRMGDGLGRVSAERMISGPGIEKVHAILAQMRDRPPQDMPIAEIARLAIGSDDELAVDTFDCFATWLGRFAGDMALTFGAGGGVYIAGGIAPKILPILEKGGFQEAFCSKGRMSDFLKTVPVHVITAPDAGLRGAAMAL